MSRVDIYNMDVMQFFASYEGDRFHGSLFDPPYGFDGGFMDEEWDRDPVVFSPKFWTAMISVMREAAIGFAFASAEKSHKMSAAIEESGISILPRNYLWSTGRGKPRFIRLSETHVYGKLSIKPSVEPLIAFQFPIVSSKFMDVHGQQGTGSYNVGGVNLSTDGKQRFPSSLVIDNDAATVMRTPDNDVSAFFTIVDRVLNSDEVFYSDKAQRSERDAGLSDMPDTKVGVLSGRRDGSLAGPVPMGKNDHPTVKPIRVGTHFASLILPPDRVVNRTIFIPFLGSGSEAIGALRAGWENVVAVEVNDRYCTLSEDRIRGAFPLAQVTRRQ